MYHTARKYIEKEIKQHKLASSGFERLTYRVSQKKRMVTHNNVIFTDIRKTPFV